MTNRKLIRPEMAKVDKDGASRSLRRKGSPPEQTNAEEFYYLKQMAARTPMVVVLTDGEQIHGWIEWYDKGALKVNRHSGPNLLIPKHSIRYMYKEEELRQRRRRGGPAAVAGASREPAPGAAEPGEATVAEASGEPAAEGG
jgi:sRNA-binding regulator protein Hfq